MFKGEEANVNPILESNTCIETLSKTTSKNENGNSSIKKLAIIPKIFYFSITKINKDKNSNHDNKSK